MRSVPSKSETFAGLVTRVQASRLPSPAVRREIRMAAGVTIREAANALGVSTISFLRWEQGSAKPRRQHAIDYAAFLDALLAAAS